MRKHVCIILQSAFILLGISVHAQQPVLINYIPVGSENFTKAGQVVFYTSGDSLLATNGTSAGTGFLKSGFDGFGGLAEYNGMLYFLTGRDPQHPDKWKSLWRSNGTASGTILLKTSSAYNLKIHATSDRYVYFTASHESTGEELYQTDGTSPGTVLLKDINPGSANASIRGVQVVGNQLFFGADNGTSGVELWKTNGTPSGTVMVKDINPGGQSGFVGENSLVRDNVFYFHGYTSATGAEPWISDGTAAGTTLLKDILPGVDGPSDIDFEIAHNGSVYFSTYPAQGSAGNEAALWKTGGTTASTAIIKNIPACMPECDFEDALHHFLVYKGKVYFFAKDETFDGLWVTDGTDSGTRGIFVIRAVEGGVTFFDVVNDHLFFHGVFEDEPHCFFKSDGTSANTNSFTCFDSQGFRVFPKDITKVGDLVFYGDHAPTGSDQTSYYYQLTQSDGFRTQPVSWIAGGSFPGTDHIVNFDGKVVFSTRNLAPGSSDKRRRLFIYDPNPAENKFIFVNADTDQDIQVLNEGDVVIQPKNTYVTIRFVPEGTPGSVVFEYANIVVRTENAAPYSIAGDTGGDYKPWLESKPGRFRVSATPYSEAGGKGIAGPTFTINFTIEEEPGHDECVASGTVLQELWRNVRGSKVSDIPLHLPPSSTAELTSLEVPATLATNYGQRLRGYLCVPITGDYTFYISSNDHSSFFLGTHPPTDNVLINVAHVFGATDPGEWGKYPSQTSQRITLIAGKQYYFEVRHKQGAGTGHVAVGWRLPNGTLERPIQGNRLSPYTDGNIPSDVAITSPEEGDTYNEPATIVINAYASDLEAQITKVMFFAGEEKLGEDFTAPYSVTWSDVPAGSYSLTAVAQDDLEGLTVSSAVNITVTGACISAGTITREYWSGVSGASVSDIPLDSPAESTQELSVFEGPSNSGENYGARMRGYICAPVSGYYRFYIASNDHSELWLGTSEDPGGKRRIAYLIRATGPREWNKFATQRSEPIALLQGQKYYIEALHKQGVGMDHIAVGWELPNGRSELPIPGNRLSPYHGGVNSLSTNRSPGEPQQTFSRFEIYPNPAVSGDPKLTLTGYAGLDKTIETNIEIINVTGEVVYSKRIVCGGDCNDYLVQLDKQLYPGLYVVNLKFNGIRISKRLLVK